MSANSPAMPLNRRPPCQGVPPGCASRPPIRCRSAMRHPPPSSGAPSRHETLPRCALAALSCAKERCPHNGRLRSLLRAAVAHRAWQPASAPARPSLPRWQAFRAPAAVPRLHSQAMTWRARQSAFRRGPLPAASARPCDRPAAARPSACISDRISYPRSPRRELKKSIGSLIVDLWSASR